MMFLARHSSFIFYFLLTLIVEMIDVWSGKHVNLWVLYCIPISMATWNLGIRPGFLFALLSTMLLAVSSIYWGHIYSTLGSLTAAITSKSLVYFVFVGLLGALRKKEIKRVFLPPLQKGERSENSSLRH